MSLKKLIKSAQSNDLALLTMELDKPKGYGRIVRDKKGTIKSIVEEKDATKEQKKIAEVNTGIMAMKSNLLLDLIPKIKKKNNINKNNSKIWFGQLYGMSDNISFNLANKGFNAIKYLPFGPIKEVIPYLIRRAEENTSVKGQTSRELELIKTELKRRKSI